MPKEVNAKFVLMISSYAEFRGIPMEWSLQGIDINAEELSNPSLRISYKKFSKFAERVLARAEDPYFGLRLGKWLNFNSAGVLSELLTSSENVISAINNLTKFSKLELGPYDVKLKNNPQSLRLFYKPKSDWLETYPEVCKQVSEMAVVFTKRFFETLVGEKNIIKSLGFIGESKELDSEFAKLIDSKCFFGQKAYWFDLPYEILDKPISTRDKLMVSSLLPYAEKRIAEFSETKTYAGKVKQVVFAFIDYQAPSIADVASNLGLSARTLQRRLQDEGVKFKTIIEELKIEIAQKYLLNPELSIKEITYLLKFSDPSTFIRSFKKSQKVTPLQWRKKHLNS